MRESPSDFTAFSADPPGQPPVRGFLHVPIDATGEGLVLTHGAGGNSRTALLVAVSRAFAAAAFTCSVATCPFARRERQDRRPPPARPAIARAFRPLFTRCESSARAAWSWAD